MTLLESLWARVSVERLRELTLALVRIPSPTGEGLTSVRHFTRARRCVLVNYFRIV